MKILSLVFLMALALDAVGEKIRVETDFSMGHVVPYDLPDGRKQIDFYGTDRRTNRDYVIHAIQDGDHWAATSPREVGYSKSPDLGPTQYMEIGPAPKEVSDRFSMELGSYMERYRENERTRNQ